MGKRKRRKKLEPPRREKVMSMGRLRTSSEDCIANEEIGTRRRSERVGRWELGLEFAARCSLRRSTHHSHLQLFSYIFHISYKNYQCN